MFDSFFNIPPFLNRGGQDRQKLEAVLKMKNKPKRKERKK